MESGGSGTGSGDQRWTRAWHTRLPVKPTWARGGLHKCIFVLLCLHGGDDDDEGVSSLVIPDRSFNGRRTSERSHGCSEPWVRHLINNWGQWCLCHSLSWIIYVKSPKIGHPEHNVHWEGGLSQTTMPNLSDRSLTHDNLKQVDSPRPKPQLGKPRERDRESSTENLWGLEKRSITQAWWAHSCNLFGQRTHRNLKS